MNILIGMAWNLFVHLGRTDCTMNNEISSLRRAYTPLHSVYVLKLISKMFYSFRLVILEIFCSICLQVCFYVTVMYLFIFYPLAPALQIHSRCLQTEPVFLILASITCSFRSCLLFVLTGSLCFFHMTIMPENEVSLGLPFKSLWIYSYPQPDRVISLPLLGQGEFSLWREVERECWFLLLRLRRWAWDFLLHFVRGNWLVSELHWFRASEVPLADGGSHICVLLGSMWW